MKHNRLLILAVFAAGLSACADSGSFDEKGHKVTPPICPQVAIVRELGHMSDYGAENPDPSELVAQARINAIDGQCEYKTDGIDVTFDLSMTAARGPRLGGLHTSFPFFVAVVSPEGKILNKELMTAEFGFASDEKTADTAESLHVFIPMEKAQRQMGPYYRVLAGFQVSEGQRDNINSKF
jgi:hypothetical protein